MIWRWQWKAMYEEERSARLATEEILGEAVKACSRANAEVQRLNRYIDELKAEGRIIVVARQYDHFQAWCRANGYHHRDTGKAIFLSTSDYKSSRGYNARPQDRVVLYGPWRGGRCANEVISVLQSCGFKREEMEEVPDA
jgi:hypothetical protein